jgi:hypothetical protein
MASAIIALSRDYSNRTVWPTNSTNIGSATGWTDLRLGTRLTHQRPIRRSWLQGLLNGTEGKLTSLRSDEEVSC